MAHSLVELYTPKLAWLDLTENERQQFFTGIGSAMLPLSALGVDTLAIGHLVQLGETAQR